MSCPVPDCPADFGPDPFADRPVWWCENGHTFDRRDMERIELFGYDRDVMDYWFTQPLPTKD